MIVQVARVARVLIAVVVGVTCILGYGGASATDPSSSDTSIDVLERSYVALGGRTPERATLLGSVTVTSGGDESSGTLRLMASGFQKTNESIVTIAGATEARFDSGDLMLIEDDDASRPPRELAVSGQSNVYPTVLISRALHGADMASAYLGDEMVGNELAKRIRVWDTYHRDPDSEFLADLTVFDIWVSASTNLPLMLRRERRGARGAAFGTIYEYRYADYRGFDGGLVPTRVTASRNYVEWFTWSVSSVSWTEPLPADAFEMTTEN